MALHFQLGRWRGATAVLGKEITEAFSKDTPERRAFAALLADS